MRCTSQNFILYIIVTFHHSEIECQSIEEQLKTIKSTGRNE